LKPARFNEFVGVESEIFWPKTGAFLLGVGALLEGCLTRIRPVPTPMWMLVIIEIMPWASSAMRRRYRAAMGQARTPHGRTTASNPRSVGLVSPPSSAGRRLPGQDTTREVVAERMGCGSRNQLRRVLRQLGQGCDVASESQLSTGLWHLFDTGRPIDHRPGFNTARDTCHCALPQSTSTRRARVQSPEGTQRQLSLTIRHYPHRNGRNNCINRNGRTRRP